MALEGCLGLEVFNANCEVEIGKGFSSQCWDDLLQRGKRWFGFATDDAHWRQDDAGQGWIMVKSPQLDRSSLLEAIRQGHFYSSTGPRIEHLELIGATVHVRCSPVAAIGFVGDGRHGLRVADPTGGLITAASYERTGRERYLRVECIDRDGTRAWSNPLWLD